MINHVRSGILGLCVADALGVPVEFKSRETLKRNPVNGMTGYGTHGQPPGTWSDDTSMTLCLLDSLSNGLNYQDIMDKFVSWYLNAEYTPYGEIFDIGISTRKSIERYIKGTEAIKCGGTDGFDNGNGSLMRILPLLFFIYSEKNNQLKSDEEIFESIHNVSALTHAHKRSQMACGIYLCIGLMILEGKDLVEAVKFGIDTAFTFYQNNIEFESELINFSRLRSDGFVLLSENEIKSTGYVIDTLEAALWCLINTNTYKECVLRAVNLGDDTDTVAAVVGGLAGIYYGSEMIPKEWLDQIARLDFIKTMVAKF